MDERREGFKEFAAALVQVQEDHRESRAQVGKNREEIKKLQTIMHEHDKRTIQTSAKLDTVVDLLKESRDDIKEVKDEVTEARVTAQTNGDEIKSIRSHVQSLSESHAATVERVDVIEGAIAPWWRKYLIGAGAFAGLLAAFKYAPEATNQALTALKELF